MADLLAKPVDVHLQRVGVGVPPLRESPQFKSSTSVMCTAICSVNASPTTMALWARRLGVRFRCEQRPCWLGDQCCLQHVGKISRGLKIRLHVVIVLKVHYAVLVDLPLTHQGACCIVQSTTLDCHAISYIRHTIVQYSNFSRLQYIQYTYSSQQLGAACGRLTVWSAVQ